MIPMALIKLLVAPIRRVVNFPPFQLTVAIAVIVLLQAADSSSVFGKTFSALDLLVDLTVRLCAATFEVKSFTKSWLTAGLVRERGIEAYRAWLPLERIRPAHIAQEEWEERFAWPANGKPPYPPLAYRVVRAALTYLAVVLIIAALLQAFTPFPVLTWLSEKARMLLQG
jgi:hypothetical protein